VRASSSRAVAPFDNRGDALLDVLGMTDPNKIDQLRGIPMFAALPDDALAQLGAAASDFDAPAGHVLVQADQPGSGLLILTSGQATVELGAQTLEFGAGECIGELSLLIDDLVHVARVRAATDVKGFAISRHDFEALLSSDSRIAVGLLRVLARRLVETDRLLNRDR
jgi:CRP/FNR family transcriptional regulator, cyclic AMP receptor protein